MWKDFFYFTKRERTGVYVLVAMIVIIIGIGHFLSLREALGVRELSDAERHEVSDFIASVKEKEKKWENHFNYDSQPVFPVILSSFDPNLADSAAFVRLGLKPYIARNILRYRAKGGKFRTPESFARIYGITSEQFKILLPYIIIDESFQLKPDTIFTRTKIDSMKYFKYPMGAVIELNGADTAELKKIPGIGGGLARMIVSYRNKLGGFYKVEQLHEIKYVSEGLSKWFTVNPVPLQKINLNKAGIERLTAHPYINFYQAKVIVEYRKKKGALKSLDQLVLYEEFTKSDFERISHYVEF